MVWQLRKPIRLVTVKAYHFRSTHWTVVLIDPEKDSTNQTEQTTGQDNNCEFCVIRDTTHTPSETEIIPATIKGGLTDLILLACCPQPPFYLAKGQIISQAIPIPAGVTVDDKSSDVYWAEVVGEDKPIMDCNLRHGTEHLHVNGLLNTGVEVTIIPERIWPPHRKLQPMAGKIHGVGGVKLVKVSKRIVQIEGPDGKLASVRPLVINFKQPLWGRDTMPQWGVKLTIPKNPKDF
ncbi:hypothetical protein DUI87_20753 [Hirundo rustica rustica]|uniref:Peptidase A2 domain-containing protein n=1 Tax=Hirundo rustica rustica TaxID=333673 RepID=A0A3M0JRB3_HIRRU|nr:hypothetical protein DUI87_20753 [Hirundo rustica rustica]